MKKIIFKKKIMNLSNSKSKVSSVKKFLDEYKLKKKFINQNNNYLKDIITKNKKFSIKTKNSFNSFNNNTSKQSNEYNFNKFETNDTLYINKLNDIKIPKFLKLKEINKKIVDNEIFIKEKINYEIKYIKKVKKYKNKIENYQIGKLIGKGSFAEVFIGRQILTNSKVAIKVISKDNPHYKLNKIRVKSEIDLLRLSFGNINLIMLLEEFEENDKIYLIFEYCNEGDIYSFIKKQGLLNENQCMEIVYQILKGLEYLHNLRIVHRDIKLDNIFICNNLKSKIGDFGISLIKNKGDIITSTAGTPCYLAPEILLGEGKLGFKSDIWALGVLLYSMFFGVFPFKSRDPQELYQQILKGNYVIPTNKKSSKHIIHIIKKMLTYKIEKRPTATQLLTHPWFKKEYIINKKEINYKDYKNCNPIKLIIVYNLLIKIGFKEDKLIKDLNSNINNHSTSCFYTLLNRI